MKGPASGAALPAAALSGLLLLSLVSGASALDKCKARISKRDGTITVKAREVVGELRWGWTPEATVGDFDNLATCVSGASARGCTLAAPGSPQRITPPPSCVLHLADDAGACSDFISGCGLAARPLCPPDMEQVGSWCIDRVRLRGASFEEHLAACHAKGRSLCPLEALVECDINRDGTGFPSESCAHNTDVDSETIWSSTPFANDLESVFEGMTLYRSDNRVDVRSTALTPDDYDAFCCERLGGH